MKRYLPLIIVIIIVAAGLVAYAFGLFGGPAEGDRPDGGVGVTDFTTCVAAGNPVMESYPRQCRTQEGQNFVEHIGNEVEKQDVIRASSPRPNQAVTSPFLVAGEARGGWFFEASFPVEIRAADGTVVALGIAQTDEEWMTSEFVPFHAYLAYPAKDLAENATLVLKKDNPSGLPEHDDQLEVPITLDSAVYAGGPQIMKVYFQNSVKDPGMLDCSKVWPVERTIGSVELSEGRTEEMGRRALEALMKGPTNVEQKDGYGSSIAFGVGVQRVTIKNGVATATFDEELEEGVAGSCRVTAIRAQIEETLKQFEGVESVVISIDGRTEDILQP